MGVINIWSILFSKIRGEQRWFGTINAIAKYKVHYSLRGLYFCIASKKYNRANRNASFGRKMTSEGTVFCSYRKNEWRVEWKTLLC